MEFSRFSVIALEILLLLVSAMALYLASELSKTKSSKRKLKLCNELSELVDRYVSLAYELKGPLREFFDMAKEAYNNPSIMPEKHIAEEIIQELVETEILIRETLKRIQYLVNQQVVDAVRNLLYPGQIRNISTHELDFFLSSVTQKAKIFFDLLRQDLEKQ